MRTQAWWKGSKNTTSLSNALWYIYSIYLNGYQTNLKEAVRSYEKRLRDPFEMIPPSVEEIEGMELVKKYLNE